jgi:hypothetical protein
MAIGSSAYAALSVRVHLVVVFPSNRAISSLGSYVLMASRKAALQRSVVSIETSSLHLSCVSRTLLIFSLLRSDECLETWIFRRESLVLIHGTVARLVWQDTSDLVMMSDTAQSSLSSSFVGTSTSNDKHTYLAEMLGSMRSSRGAEGTESVEISLVRPRMRLNR